MPHPPSICVTDANIWIDVHNGGLVREIFRLPLQFIAPDLVIEELESPDSNLLMQQGLQRGKLDSNDVMQLLSLSQRHRSRVSTEDLAALVLARKLQVMLLTGDSNLTRIAKSYRLQVHGILWLLDEIVRLQIISPQSGRLALKKILNGGARLPRTECDKRLKLWQP